jgi:DNA-binding NtrC family response regulator/predicted hydrocarbon binding protein
MVVYMKADDLKFEELFEITEGRLELHGRRFIIHSINAFAQLRRDLINNIGPAAARGILTRFGFFAGQADAATMKRVFKWDSTYELLKSGPKFLSLLGSAETSIDNFEYDDKNGIFNMRVVLTNSGEAEEHITEFGQSKAPVCWILTGFLSGFASYCLNKNIYFREDKCRAFGSRKCVVEGMDELSWGAEFSAIASNFQAEDIKTKVLQLTEELKKKNVQLEKQSEKIARFEQNTVDAFLDTKSAVFRKTLDLAFRVAHFDTSVLITGETGSGKEVLARYIHLNSLRSKKPFVAINCCAIPENLLESELFGHKAGSFTGAIKDRTGIFEEANNGTIFLDEIGDISPSLQSKLLRVLQEKEITRVGENIARKINVRILAATNQDLDAAVLTKNFREDLLYRIRVIEINIPPLTERREDILPLARFFVNKFSVKLAMPKLKLDSTCVDVLQEYNWPGNIRELENAIERAAILAENYIIKPENLPFLPSMKEILPSSDNLSIADIEKAHIKSVLDSCGGNRSRTAKILGISLSTLWRKLK